MTPTDLVPASAWIQYGLVVLTFLLMGATGYWLMIFLRDLSVERDKMLDRIQRLIEDQRAEREARDEGWKAWLFDQAAQFRSSMEKQAAAHRDHIALIAKEHREGLAGEISVLSEALVHHRRFMEDMHSSYAAHLEALKNLAPNPRRRN